MARNDNLIRLCGGVVVCAAALVVSVLEVFLVPLRLWYSYVPVAAMLAVAGNIVFPIAMRYATRGRLVVMLPGLIWFVIAIIGTSPTMEGDLLIPAIWPGIAMLLAGAVTVTVVGYVVMSEGRVHSSYL